MKHKITKWVSESSPAEVNSLIRHVSQKYKGSIRNLKHSSRTLQLSNRHGSSGK
jgi:hypothetical protein